MPYTTLGVAWSLTGSGTWWGLRPEISPTRCPPVGAETSALATEAATEIARFDAEFGASAMAFAPLLLRSESASSSQIEHLTSSACAIALAALGRTGRNNDLIVSNIRAMQAAMDLAERLDGDAILAMHRVLMKPHWPDIAGCWREQQVWIGGSRFGPHGADFVPPHPDRVPAGISDLSAFMSRTEFMGRTDIPVLTHAAIAHAQFETIHPFPDGNGRVGRALVHALLNQGDLQGRSPCLCRRGCSATRIHTSPL